MAASGASNVDAQCWRAGDLRVHRILWVTLLISFLAGGSSAARHRFSRADSNNAIPMFHLPL